MLWINRSQLNALRNLRNSASCRSGHDGAEVSPRFLVGQITPTISCSSSYKCPVGSNCSLKDMANTIKYFHLFTGRELGTKRGRCIEARNASAASSDALR